MANQNPDHSEKLNPEPNDTHESTSKTDRPIGVGENEENHTSGNHIQYQKEGKSSQHETGGDDGKNIHTDNQGGNTGE